MNLRFEEEAKKEKRKRLIIASIRYAVEVILVIALAWCIINLCLKKVTMIGSSMDNTLHSGQEVIVNTFFKHFGAPDRNSVIAFYPERGVNSVEDLTDSAVLIRRIVGLPGETVKISGGFVYVNGEKLEEDYEFDRNVSAGQAEEDYKLGEDEFFVLSDKRADLDDSRSTSFTKVKRDNIIGTVFLTLDPFSTIAGPEKEEPEETEE
ncbi:MAG: signal peptidase I [Eubacterium sp.]|nr:signal peptidase I [Eubacterium sp.]